MEISHWKLSYHPEVKNKDIRTIPENIRNRIRRAIETRLVQDPVLYGEPLRRSLKGYRKLRVGDYRVIYRIEHNEIFIIKIGHRREIYDHPLS